MLNLPLLKYIITVAKGNCRYIREALEYSKVTKKFAAKGNPNLQHQVLLLDALTRMHLAQRAAGIEEGTAKSLAEELLLHLAQLLHGHMLEEGRQLLVCQDAAVEVLHQALDAFLASDALKEI